MEAMHAMEAFPGPNPAASFAASLPQTRVGPTASGALRGEVRTIDHVPTGVGVE